MALFEEIEYFVRNIATGFDCDSDAHRYNTYCRCCKAEELLAQLKGEPGCKEGNPCYRMGCLSCFCHGNIKYLSYEQAIVQDGTSGGYKPATPSSPAEEPALMKKPAEDLSAYVEQYQDSREKWLAWYFSWTETKDVTQAELHTARDGFDAGANWQEKRKSTVEGLIESLEKLSEVDRAKVLARFRGGPQ